MNTEDLNEVLNRATETLTTELKSWIDPGAEEDIAKIAIACMALRNQDGGVLILGFNDDGSPCAPPSFDVRKKYEPDVIQGLVSKYAHSPFEIEMHFVESNGQEYPVVVVPAGVRTPVVAKSDLHASSRTKPLIRCDTVYVRTLSSNGTVSSAPARASDWESLVERCFDNREADIGRFVQRYLPELLGFAARVQSNDPLLSYGESSLERFRKRIEKVEGLVLPRGWFTTTCVCSPEFDGWQPDENFLRKVLLNNPRHSGWPFWIDSRPARDAMERPNVFDGSWESLVVAPGTSISHIDFWRIHPAGSFFHKRGLEDDLVRPQYRKIDPGRCFDFVIAISRIAEVVSCLLSFAQALQADANPERKLLIQMRWEGLSDRRLVCWSDPGRDLATDRQSIQDEYVFHFNVPIDTPKGALPRIVHQASAGLLAVFEGTNLSIDVVTDIANRTLGRRM